MQSEYPIDTEQLKKGDVISADDIERAYQVKRDTDAYRIAMLKCRAYVQHRLAERELFIVAKFDKYSVRILTDAEAARYTDDEFDRGTRKLRRALGQQASVDRANLDGTQLAKHDRALVVNGASYQGLRKARRKEIAAPAATQRQTPALRK